LIPLPSTLSTLIDIERERAPGEIRLERLGDKIGEDSMVQRRRFSVGSMDCSRRSRRHDDWWPVE